jgi:pimeloyl-ACP methyl ester carboxylesterase
MLDRILYLLPNPIERAQVDAALPHIEFQLHKTRLALATAAENYFSAEARVSHSLETLGHALRDHPWLLRVLPQSTLDKIRVGGAVAYGVAQLAPGDFASQSTQLLASSTNLGGQADKAQRVGLLNDRPVSFHLIASSQRAPIRSLAEIGSRLDEVNEAKKQIRVETYVSQTGQRTLMVYLPGTQSLLPVAGDNPFDLTSDTQLATDARHSQLLTAIRQALAESGAKGSKVIFAGYSLGGIAAAQLAAQGGLDVAGVVTIGSPVGQVHLPSNVPVLSVQHNNDPIPAATGAVNPLTENWATVSREAKLPLGAPALAAHNLDRYCETLGLVDKTHISGVSRVREMILSQLKGSKLETTQTFEFDR